MTNPPDPVPADAEEASLDLVQRLVVSGLITGVMVFIIGAMVYFLATTARNDLPYSSVVGLWVMTGVMGLITAGGVLALHGRTLLNPLLLLGLLPMAVSWYWVLGS